jgi:hypothetical protein
MVSAGEGEDHAWLAGRFILDLLLCSGSDTPRNEVQASLWWLAMYAAQKNGDEPAPPQLAAMITESRALRSTASK